MIEQLRYLTEDYRRLCGTQKWRMIYIWMNRTAVGIIAYRLDRGMFLTFGSLWTVIRILLYPLVTIAQAYSNCDIHYKANIKGGLAILHSSPGVVISGKAKIGKYLTLTGGNVIGVRNAGDSEIAIGDNCSVGANAVILSPARLGNHVTIGACALVLKDFEDGSILIGVPARCRSRK